MRPVCKARKARRHIKTELEAVLKDFMFQYSRGQRNILSTKISTE
jgi:hypothetical protein